MTVSPAHYDGVMRVALLLMLSLSSGCYEAAFVDCGTGLVCPVGMVCDIENNTCFDPSPGCGNRVVEPELGEVCDDGNTIAGDGCHPSCTATQVCGDGVLDSGEVCDDGNSTAGDGCHPSCTAFAICGDGVLDAGEVCDDNNNVATDDCSSDCRSTLACGNGLLDTVVGEQCDDGNRTGLDGCDASCALEQPRWLEVGMPTPPWTGAIAYDAARARSVLYVDANTLGVEMWERYGWSWRRLPTQAPAGIRAATFHRVDREVVGVALGQAYRWDGTRWWPRGSAPARLLQHLLYDGADRLFATSNVGEVFDLSASVTVPAGTLPNSAGGAFTAGFDPKHALLVRHGGLTTVSVGGGLPSVQTTTNASMNGASWQSAAPGGPPVANAPALWDARLQRLLFVGGQVSLGVQTATVQHLDTSSSNPATWAWETPSSMATAREGGVAAHDTLRESTVVVGGASGSFPNVMYSTVTEVLDSNGWRGEVTTAPNPTRLFEVPDRGIAVATTAFNDVWSYNRDQGWIHHTTATVPATNTSTPAVFADTSTRTIVWTGSGSTCTISDDIAQGTWSCASSTSVISARVGAVAAYDSAMEMGVLFGGQATPVSQWLGDTYVWRSSAWTAAPAVTIGAGCQRPQLVHDDAAGKFILLCNELVATTLLPRAWSWNGDESTPWQREPDPPLDGLLVFNRDLRLTMLIATQGATFLLVNGQWQLQPIEKRRALPFLGAATYLSADRETIAMNASSMFVLTWESATTEVCLLDNDHDGDGLVGCADADCWGRCTPRCFAGSPATCLAARCGDGVASSLENCHTCPQDVGVCAVVCGDQVCSTGETNCPGDCGP